MSTTTEEKNEHLSVKVERHPGCIAKLEIEVSPTAARAAYEKAFKNIKREVSIPGFRKGKAPDEIITKNFKKAIHEEWENLLVRTSVNDTLELTKITPNGQEGFKKIQVKKASLEEPSLIIAELECRPEIPDVDFKSFKLEVPAEKRPFEEELELAMRNVQLQHAKWNELNDKAVEEGDYVMLDIESAEDPEQKYCTDGRFHIEKGTMADWLHNLLLGKRVGDVFEGLSDPTETESESDEPLRCRVTLKGIQAAELPAWDDELAKLCKCADAEELKNNVTKQLENFLLQKKQETLSNQVREQLVSHYAFDMPAVNRSLPFLTNEKQLLWLICSKIARENNIHVTEGEMSAATMQFYYANARAGRNMEEYSKDPQLMQTMLYVELMTQKVLNFIADKVTEEA